MAEKQYDNEMRFALFENDKAGNEKRPDRRGTAQINGVEYKLSGWIKTSKDGKRFLSGTIEPTKTNESAPPANQQQQGQQDKSDDVPF